MKRCPKCNRVYDNSWGLCLKCGKALISFSKKEVPSVKVRKCPYCAEEVREEAIKCKHCGSLLEGKEVGFLEVESMKHPERRGGYSRGAMWLAILFCMPIAFLMGLVGVCSSTQVKRQQGKYLIFWCVLIVFVGATFVMSNKFLGVDTPNAFLPVFGVSQSQEGAQVDLSGYELVYDTGQGLVSSGLELGGFVKAMLEEGLGVEVTKRGAQVVMSMNFKGKGYQLFYSCDEEHKICEMTAGKWGGRTYPGMGALNLMMTDMEALE